MKGPCRGLLRDFENRRIVCSSNTNTFQVPLIQNAECEVWHERAGITVQLYPEMMCAGYRDGGKDSCKVGTMSR